MRLRKELSKTIIKKTDTDIARVANALGHPLRVALVRYLYHKDTGSGIQNDICNKDLVEIFGYSQSNLSQHIKILKESEIFITEQRERFTIYFLNKKLIEQFKNWLNF